MPWARLHATKGYNDMAAWLEAVPEMRVTFNLAPSLVEQLEAYAAGATDALLCTVQTPADTLDEAARLRLLADGFSANVSTMVSPHPRYATLLAKRGPDARHDALTAARSDFTIGDFRDLQVWCTLAWCGRSALENEPLLAELIAKGQAFTEDDKATALAAVGRVAAGVVGRYRSLAERGQAELSTSPYYHPILPLLCDLESAREARPGLSLPSVETGWVEDARAQIADARAFHARTFGASPEGLWPSEGAISTRVLELMGEEGVGWTASDEGVLEASLGGDFRRAHTYSPHRFGSEGPVVLFRDHTLADRIGFDYQRMHGPDAVAEFVSRLHAIREALEGVPGPHLVTIVLDGENPWEHYLEGGSEFVPALYAALASNPAFEPTTPSAFLAEHPARERLTRVRAGSWIDADLTTWIGSTEANRAWSALVRAHERAETAVAGNSGVQTATSEHLAIVQGSDWFWWYGGRHSSPYDATFDGLFRGHLSAVYAHLGEAAPAELAMPFTRTAHHRLTEPPVGPVHPRIDGRTTHYYEWVGAGRIVAAGGSMAKGERALCDVRFGYDADALYLRIGFADPAFRKALDATIRLGFDIPVTEGGNVEVVVPLAEPSAAHVQGRGTGKVEAALGPVLEVRVAQEVLATDSCSELGLVIRAFRGSTELERWPESGVLLLPPAEEVLSEWFV